MLYTNAFKGTVYLCVSDRFHGGEDDFILKSRTTKIQTQHICSCANTTPTFHSLYVMNTTEHIVACIHIQYIHTNTLQYPQLNDLTSPLQQLLSLA